MTGDLEYLRDRLVALPLKDAAYELWISRYCLDTEERRLTIEANLQSYHPRTIDAANSIRETKKSATLRTEQRLQTTFVSAKAGDIAFAVSLAQRLDVACQKYCELLQKKGHWPDVKRAVAKARAENPDFLDSTYDKAGNEMMRVSR